MKPWKMTLVTCLSFIMICLQACFIVPVTPCEPHQPESMGMMATDFSRADGSVIREASFEAAFSNPDAFAGSMDVATTPETGVVDGSAATSDGGAMPISIPVPSGEVLVMPIESSRCRDGTLRLPAAFSAPDLQVWHICYTTPDPHDVGYPGRSSALTFTLVTELTPPALRQEILTVSAPRTANPWTAGMVIGIPRITHVAPQINARLELGMGTGAWAVASNPIGTDLVQIGSFRIWRVNPDGRQELQGLKLVADHCTDQGVPDLTLAGDVFPLLATCPDPIAFCGNGPLHCP